MASTPVHEQPQSVDPPTVPTLSTSSPKSGGLKDRALRIKKKYTTRDGWLGDYDYAWYAGFFLSST